QPLSHYNLARAREWSRVAPHAVDDVDGQQQPGQILQQHNRQLGRRVDAADLLAKYNRDVRQHNRAVNDAGNTNPLLSLAIGIDGNRVERPKEQGINPDGGFPPGGPGNDQRIECASPPVDEIDGSMSWPDG